MLADARRSLFLFICWAKKKDGSPFSTKSTGTMLSAIRDHLEAMGAVNHRSELDSSTLRLVLKGYTRLRNEESANGTPTCKIAFVSSLVPIFVRIAISTFGQERARFLIAAMFLASNSGLRPSEWSPFYSSANAKPIALAVNTYVGNVHTDQWVRLTRLAQQPPQDYTSILILLTSKADPQGKAPCRTISRHSGGPHARFTDAFESILGVLKDYPPLDTVGAGIFSGIPDPRLLQFQVREVLGRVALELNLPRERLTLHSMRLFILAQLMAADVDTGTIRLMVGWRSESGIKPYYRSFVKKGVRFADALHDTDAISPSQLVIINSNIATPGR